MTFVRRRVLCLGNTLVSDDGVGIRVGEVLDRLGLCEDVVIEQKPALGFELLDTLTPGEQLVIVDAMRTGAEPGTCAVLAVDDVEALARSPFCCHGVGLAELLALARRLDPERVPRALAVVGVEAAVLDRYGCDLSPAVQAALPEVVNTVLGLLEAAPASFEAARTHFENVRA